MLLLLLQSQIMDIQIFLEPVGYQKKLLGAITQTVYTILGI